jgi:hypothetical protein
MSYENNYYQRVKNQGWKKGDLIRTDYGLCLVEFVDLEPKDYEPRNWGDLGLWRREVMCDRDSYIWKWAVVEAKVLTSHGSPNHPPGYNGFLNPGTRIAFMIHPTRKQRVGGSVFSKLGYSNGTC